jgi:hypothetical protein
MDVVVIDILWINKVPIATVYSELAGDIFSVNLLHEAFVQRHGIGKGSSLHLTDARYIVSTTTATHEYVPRPVSDIDHDTEHLFRSWFVFRAYFKGALTNKVLRLLFLAGIDTVENLRRHSTALGHIPGIGPATRKVIRSLFESG